MLPMARLLRSIDINTCVQGSGNLRLAVELPDGEDANEWLAVHGQSISPVHISRDRDVARSC